MRELGSSISYCLPFCHTDKVNLYCASTECLKLAREYCESINVCDGGICEVTNKQGSGQYVDHVCRLRNTAMPRLTEIGTMMSRIDTVGETRRGERHGGGLATFLNAKVH